MGERQWYVTPIQKSALPGGRDILIDEHNGYHPGRLTDTYTVLPRFDTSQGVRRHSYWPPDPDPALVAAGLQPTSVKAGYPAPGYEGELYRGTNVPPWGQPVWFQGQGGLGSVQTVITSLVPVAVGLSLAVAAWWVLRSLWPARQTWYPNPEDHCEAADEHTGKAQQALHDGDLDTAWLNLIEAKAHVEVLREKKR